MIQQKEQFSYLSINSQVPLTIPIYINTYILELELELQLQVQPGVQKYKIVYVVS